MAIEKETISQFVRPDGAVREILTEEVRNVRDANLCDLLPFGFAIHHAGMMQEDRALTEELFADGNIQVECYTCVGCRFTCSHCHHQRHASIRPGEGSLGRVIVAGRVANARPSRLSAT